MTLRPFLRCARRRALLSLLGLASLASSGLAEAPSPLIPDPLRDPAIVVAPDGVFWLTGTPPGARGEFLDNDGVYLWSSTDLKTWKAHGKVWALDVAADRGNATRWTQYLRMNPRDPDGPWVRGVDSPELHHIKGEWYVAFAMSGGGTGLLKSQTGKPEGPYEIHARITTAGSTPSIFVDDDGKVYWLWDGGWIAPLNAALTKLDGPAQFLRPATESQLGDYPVQVGDRGAFLFKHDGKYNLVATETTPRLGSACRDTFTARADSLFGPYGPRRLMVPHGNQVTVFRQGSQWMSTFGGDPQAVFADRAGAVPLVDDGFLKHFSLQRPTRTEGLSISNLQATPLPAKGDPKSDQASIRDPQILLDKDGTYYLVGTTSKAGLRVPGLRIWRSKDLKTWEATGDERGVTWYVDQAEWCSKPFHPDVMPHPVHDFWAPEIHRVGDDYYIPFCMFGGGTGMLKSSSGKPEGPYEDWTGRLHTWAGDPSLLVDDDGTVYMHLGFGPTQLVKMSKDMRKFDGKPFYIGPADGSVLGHEGGYVTRMLGKYVLFYTTLNGEEEVERKSKQSYHQISSYDFVYCWADNLRGPWSRPRVAVPHGGHGAVFQDKTGDWMGVMFGTDRTAPIKSNLGIYRLDVRFENGELIVKPLSNPALDSTK